MNSKEKADAHLIDLFNQTYRYHKRVIYEYENGIKDYDFMKFRASSKIVKHIDTVASEFTGKIKLIIDSEVLGNKKGTKWYQEYFSAPCYYQTRKVAYRLFLENIEK